MSQITSQTMTGTEAGTGTGTMSSLQRVLTTIGQSEPDRVPLFLLLTMHGARELGLSIHDYFADPRNVVEGQLRMRAKYRNDCYYAFFYAAIETKAWGAEVIYIEDGPPSCGGPLVRNLEDIRRLQLPRVADSPDLKRVLDAIAGLRARDGEMPIIGVVMSPFSLPVMQLGFERYLMLMLEHPELFEHLMALNEAFCVDWANAQIKAGATAICYFDPVSSQTISRPEDFRRLGKPVAVRTIAKIQGPVATHFASGRCLRIIDDLPATGAALIGVSADEDLGKLKQAAAGRLTLFGNLNGIAMRRWDASAAEQAVKQAIAAAGPGGGFILSDNHGEIPFQVPEETLLAIADAVERWGRYPLDWVTSKTSGSG
ncbi:MULTISPECIES: uroporphyrinogen decarboxylase family protein [Thiorhodovibrio]|uniref:uroporphyrinogen decarboxylase family protein n=1 Tax=Thiorhodovibrio TaxID=61593 RepID=UPI001911E143|nr:MULTISPECIES: uroporphyrinogen decarboxylase family protein [Thiorhodovibrio]MBK5970688.1 methylcobamide--CoM methyltransferase MtbA [Thiorhodovibrio winogradskyi]WPL14232.1 Uroporphyrinogen decarboxylase [Thiorhodovibrio litoralis]